METSSDIIESLVEQAESYGKTTIELTKLKSVEISAAVVSVLLTRLTVILAILLFTIFINIGIALLLGDVLGKSYYGFFIIALFYLITAVVFYFFLHGWIR